MRERRLFRSILLGSALTTLVTLGMAWDASAVSVDEERSTSYYQDALKQLENGDPAAAIIQLRNALQQNPENRDARLLLGQLYIRAGDGPSAEKELRRALQIRPDDETEILLGNALLMQQKYEEVLSDISREASTPEMHREKLLLHGNAQFGLGRAEEAEKLYREVLDADPKSVGGHFALARLKAAQNDFDAAREQLQAALDADPTFFDGWLLKAEIALRLRQYDAALKSVDKADSIRPGDPRVHLTRAQALLQTGKFAEGENEVKAVLEQQPEHPFAKYLQAGIHFGRGEYEQADRIFVTIQDQLRNFTPALLLGGAIKLGSGQYAQAEDMLTRYISVRPDNVAAARMLALVHLRQDAPQSAVEVLEPLLNRNPGDIAARQLLASAYMRVDRYDDAAELFEQIARSGSPADVQEARTSLSLLRQSFGGDVASAGESGGDAGRVEETDELSKGILRVLDYMRTRELDRALAEVKELESAHPDNPILLNIEGGVYLAQGNEDLARERFEQALAINPDFMSALNNLDRLDLRAGNAEAVERRMRDRLAQNPNDERMVLRLAQFLAGQKRIDEAHQLLESARASMPENVAIRRALVLAYLQAGNREAAIPIAKEVADIASQDLDALMFAGRALFDAGAPADAAELFQKAEALEPMSPTIKVARADALYAADRKDEARALLNGLRADDPGNVVAATALIKFALAENRSEEALQIAQQLKPHNAIAAAHIEADVLLRIDRADDAIKVLSDAFQANPASELALDLFMARRAAGKTDAAIEGLEGWLEKKPDDRQARLALASALLETGKYEASAAQYEELLNTNPNDAGVLNNLAWLMNELGRPNAVAYARRAWGLAPGSPEVADTLGWLLVQSDQASEGLNLLREAASAAPGNPDIQYHLAYALHATGERKAAQQILEKLLATDQSFMERDAARTLLAELRG